MLKGLVGTSLETLTVYEIDDMMVDQKWSQNISIINVGDQNVLSTPICEINSTAYVISGWINKLNTQSTQ